MPTKRRKAREWWVHWDRLVGDGKGIVSCVDQSGVCMNGPEASFRVREILTPKKRGRK